MIVVNKDYPSQSVKCVSLILGEEPTLFT